MEIIITCGLNIDSLITLLKTYHGEAQYTLLMCNGLKARFLVETDANTDIKALTKQIIRRAPIGQTLLFQIEVVG